jgi:aminoglycoside phosphotransferase (APT) family kinase protein
MLREIRLLTALHDTDVPHAPLIAACGDESVLNGAVFYLMEPSNGFNAGLELPPLHESDRRIRYQMGLAMVDALAILGTLDYRAVGLEGFGRPDGFLDRQVARWLAELETYSRLDNYGASRLPVELVGDWLVRNKPQTHEVGIMHGDYQVSNVLFEPTGSGIAAVVDWEMCTIGAPLLDLGLLLAIWRDPQDRDDVVGSALSRAGGLPSKETIIARYAERTGWDVSAADWYTVLACFKFGIILEGTYARSCAGLADRAVGHRLHGAAVRLFKRACSLTTRG